MEVKHVKASLRALHSCAQRLSLGVITQELQIFSRLLYRNKNQHRNDQAFQRLNRVAKDARRYESIALPKCLKQFLNIFRRAEGLTVTMLKAAEEMAAKLRECAVFLSRLIDFTEVTFSCVDQRLSKGLFVPFNLAMVSCLSRFWTCLKCHLLAISEAYNALRPLLGESCKLPVALSLSVEKGTSEDFGKPSTEGAIPVLTGKQKAAVKGQQCISNLVTNSAAGQTAMDAVTDVVNSNVLGVHDVGVPVSLNESQVSAREKDFALPGNLAAFHGPIQHRITQENRDSHTRRTRGRKRPNVTVLHIRHGGKVLKIKLCRMRTVSSVSQGSNGCNKLLAVKQVHVLKRPLPWHRVTTYHLRFDLTSRSSLQTVCQRPTFSKRALSRSIGQISKPSFQHRQRTFVQELKAVTVETDRHTQPLLGGVMEIKCTSRSRQAKVFDSSIL